MTEATPTSPTETPAGTTQTETNPAASEPTTQTAPPASDPAPREPGTADTLLTTPEENSAEPIGAPETYTDFEAPEGITLDKDAITAASAMFKEQGLSQKQAQAVVTAQAKREAEIVQRGKDAWHAMNDKWAADAKTEFGGRFPEVRATIGRAINASGLTDAQKSEFAQAMNLTAAGNNPAFIRMFYALAKQVTDGRPVAAGGPVDQAKPNGAKPATFAQAIYGNSAPQRG